MCLIPPHCTPWKNCLFTFKNHVHLNVNQMDVKLWISFDLALFHFDVKFPFVLKGYGLLLLQLFMMRRLPVLLFPVTQTPWYCDWNRSAVGTACNCSAPAIGIVFSLYFVQLIVEIWNLQLLVLMTHFQSFSVAPCLHSLKPTRVVLLFEALFSNHLCSSLVCRQINLLHFTRCINWNANSFFSWQSPCDCLNQKQIVLMMTGFLTHTIFDLCMLMVWLQSLVEDLGSVLVPFLNNHGEPQYVCFFVTFQLEGHLWQQLLICSTVFTHTTHFVQWSFSPYFISPSFFNSFHASLGDQLTQWFPNVFLKHDIASTFQPTLDFLLTPCSFLFLQITLNPLTIICLILDLLSVNYASSTHGFIASTRWPRCFSGDFSLTLNVIALQELCFIWARNT